MVSNFSNDSIDMDDILEFVISLLIKKGSWIQLPFYFYTEIKSIFVISW
jgi:hypothetical protein